MEDYTVIRRYDRYKYPPPGAKGGENGGRSKFVIRVGTKEETLTPSAGKFELKTGESFYLESAGGGGFGDPKKRERERIKRDIAEGYVSEKATKEKYGF